MIPILFESTATDFTTNGLGRLSDACSCTVVEERNGAYELELTYPVDGIHYSDIGIRSIILARPNTTAQNPQPFRVYKITKPLAGLVTVYAQHISYDLSGTIVKPFIAMSAASAISGLESNAIGLGNFHLWTDIVSVNEMVVDKPCSLRSRLGGTEGSVIDVYGGEYEYDGFTVKLHASRGANNGVSLRYGKNLLSLSQEENCANCYTAVYPYWQGTVDDDSMVVQGSVISAGTFDYTKILALDCSNVFNEMPTPAALDAYARSYAVINQIGVPAVSLSVSFVMLEQAEEYKDKAIFERVALCDTVNIFFEKIGVNATAKVNKTIYNVLLDRFDSIDLGDARKTIADTIVAQQNAIDNIELPEQEVTKSMMNEAIANATKLITGNLGGYVVLHSSAGQAEPDEILIMDKPHIDGADPAQKVWRWNNSGLGYSSTGYAGPYGTAITSDGKIVADFITTGKLNASLIKAGVLQSVNGTTFKLDLNAGTLSMQNGTISITGHKEYKNYTQAEVTLLAGIIIGRTVPTQDQITRYDLNGDGYLTATDQVRLAQIAGTSTKMDVDWTLEISPTNAITLTKTTKLGSYAPVTTVVFSSNAGAVQCTALSTKQLNAEIGLFHGDISSSGTIKTTDTNGTTQASIDNTGKVSCKNINCSNPPWPEKTQIGTFVYGLPSGDSTNACVFIPIGTSGTFQLGSGSAYRRFSIDAYGNITSGTVTGVAVYNY